MLEKTLLGITIVSGLLTHHGVTASNKVTTVLGLGILEIGLAIGFIWMVKWYAKQRV